MTSEYSKYEEAAIIRLHYNEAVQEAYKPYYESEEVAADFVLEIFRLENLSFESKAEEEERSDRLTEKIEILARTKETMRSIPDKLHTLVRDRDKFISEIYTSIRIVNFEPRLSDLTPWLQDLLVGVHGRTETAKLNAKTTTEISKAKNYYR